jgi:predicted transglutaminase-like cysteine proteinase
MAAGLAADTDVLSRWQALQSLILQVHDTDTPGKVAVVNRFFNGYPQIADLDNWGVRDYWSTPAELVQRGQGDCEDLDIANFYTLIGLGIPEDRLRLTISKVYNAGSQRIAGHMVLVFIADDGSEWVFDNNDRSMRSLVARTDLVPQLSFNRAGQWLFVHTPAGTVQNGLHGFQIRP